MAFAFVIAFELTGTMLKSFCLHMRCALQCITSFPFILSWIGFIAKIWKIIFFKAFMLCVNEYRCGCHDAIERLMEYSRYSNDSTMFHQSGHSYPHYILSSNVIAVFIIPHFRLTTNDRNYLSFIKAEEILIQLTQSQRVVCDITGQWGRTQLTFGYKRIHLLKDYSTDTTDFCLIINMLRTLVLITGF